MLLLSTMSDRCVVDYIPIYNRTMNLCELFTRVKYWYDLVNSSLNTLKILPQNYTSDIFIPTKFDRTEYFHIYFSQASRAATA